MTQTRSDPDTSSGGGIWIICNVLTPQKYKLIFKPPNNQMKTENKDYDAFVEKFKPKKTTDDCYTPPAVYEAVKEWVLDKVPSIRSLEVIRPFYPGGDYQAEDYAGKVVIDNPPFSILSKIKRFYSERNVPFFLFAPHLTLLSSFSLNRYTAVCVGVSVTYENGAVVNTSFVSNLFGDLLAFTAPDLAKAVTDAQMDRERKKLPKYLYPGNVLTTSRLNWICDKGLAVEVRNSEALYISRLDSQKELKKGLFGNGFLISEQARQRIEEAERRAEEIAERRARADYEWPLSEREKELIRQLSTPTKPTTLEP